MASEESVTAKKKDINDDDPMQSGSEQRRSERKRKDRPPLFSPDDFDTKRKLSSSLVSLPSPSGVAKKRRVTRSKFPATSAADRPFDTLPNGQPFTCDLCQSPYVCNPLMSKGGSRGKRSRHMPIPRQKLNPVTGKLLTLCNACCQSLEGPRPSRRVVPVSQEEKEAYLTEAKAFAADLADRLQDSEAERFYCPSYNKTPCRCLQKYIGAEGTPEQVLERGKELLLLYKQSRKLAAEKVYNLDKLVNKRSSKRQAPYGSIGLGNGHKRSKRFEAFVLQQRKRLKHDLHLCEKATQRILCYSNNFLHKKLKTEERGRRAERQKGKAALGLLDPLETLGKRHCCVDRCVWMVYSHKNLLSHWRRRAMTSQREARRVLAEMLTPSGGMRCNCYKFIGWVTGCSHSTISKVRAQMQRTKGDREPPLHGLYSFWEQKLQQSAKQEGESTAPETLDTGSRYSSSQTRSCTDLSIVDSSSSSFISVSGGTLSLSSALDGGVEICGSSQEVVHLQEELLHQEWPSSHQQSRIQQQATTLNHLQQPWTCSHDASQRMASVQQQVLQQMTQMQTVQQQLVASINSLQHQLATLQPAAPLTVAADPLLPPHTQLCAALPAPANTQTVAAVPNNQMVAGVPNNQIMPGVPTNQAGVPTNQVVAGVPNNQMVAGVPNNQIMPGVPNNQIMAGVPNNQIVAGVPNNQTVAGVPNNQTVAGVPNNHIVAGVPNNQIVAGVPNSQTAAGVPNNQTVPGVPNNQIASRVPYNHAVVSAPNNHMVTGVPNNQTVVGVPNNQMVAGVPNNQTVVRMPNNQTVVGLPNNQMVVGVPTNQTMAGVPNNQTVVGVPNNQIIAGVPNNQIIAGVPNNQIVTGMPNNQIVTGMPNNQMVAGVPNNQMVTGVPNNQLVAGIPNPANTQVVAGLPSAPITQFVTGLPNPLNTHLVTRMHNPPNAQMLAGLPNPHISATFASPSNPQPPTRLLPAMSSSPAPVQVSFSAGHGQVVSAQVIHSASSQSCTQHQFSATASPVMSGAPPVSMPNNQLSTQEFVNPPNTEVPVELGTQPLPSLLMPPFSGQSPNTRNIHGATHNAQTHSVPTERQSHPQNPLTAGAGQAVYGSQASTSQLLPPPGSQPSAAQPEVLPQVTVFSSSQAGGWSGNTFQVHTANVLNKGMSLQQSQAGVVTVAPQQTLLFSAGGQESGQQPQTVQKMVCQHQQQQQHGLNQQASQLFPQVSWKSSSQSPWTDPGCQLPPYVSSQVVQTESSQVKSVMQVEPADGVTERGVQQQQQNVLTQQWTVQQQQQMVTVAQHLQGGPPPPLPPPQQPPPPPSLPPQPPPPPPSAPVLVTWIQPELLQQQPQQQTTSLSMLQPTAQPVQSGGLSSSSLAVHSLQNCAPVLQASVPQQVGSGAIPQETQPSCPAPSLSHQDQVSASGQCVQQQRQQSTSLQQQRQQSTSLQQQRQQSTSLQQQRQQSTSLQQQRQQSTSLQQQRQQSTSLQQQRQQSTSLQQQTEATPQTLHPQHSGDPSQMPQQDPDDQQLFRPPPYRTQSGRDTVTGFKPPAASDPSAEAVSPTTHRPDPTKDAVNPVMLVSPGSSEDRLQPAGVCDGVEGMMPQPLPHLMAGCAMGQGPGGCQAITVHGASSGLQGSGDRSQPAAQPALPPLVVDIGGTQQSTAQLGHSHAKGTHSGAFPDGEKSSGLQSTSLCMTMPGQVSLPVTSRSVTVSEGTSTSAMLSEPQASGRPLIITLPPNLVLAPGSAPQQVVVNTAGVNTAPVTLLLQSPADLAQVLARPQPAPVGDIRAEVDTGSCKGLSQSRPGPQVSSVGDQCSSQGGPGPGPGPGPDLSLNAGQQRSSVKQISGKSVVPAAVNADSGLSKPAAAAAVALGVPPSSVKPLPLSVVSPSLRPQRTSASMVSQTSSASSMAETMSWTVLGHVPLSVPSATSSLPQTLTWTVLPQGLSSSSVPFSSVSSAATQLPVPLVTLPQSGVSTGQPSDSSVSIPQTLMSTAAAQQASGVPKTVLFSTAATSSTLPDVVTPAPGSQTVAAAAKSSKKAKTAHSSSGRKRPKGKKSSAAATATVVRAAVEGGDQLGSETCTTSALIGQPPVVDTPSASSSLSSVTVTPCDALNAPSSGKGTVSASRTPSLTTLLLPNTLVLPGGQTVLLPGIGSQTNSSCTLPSPADGTRTTHTFSTTGDSSSTSSAPGMVLSSGAATHGAVATRTDGGAGVEVASSTNQTSISPGPPLRSLPTLLLSASSGGQVTLRNAPTVLITSSVPSQVTLSSNQMLRNVPTILSSASAPSQVTSSCTQALMNAPTSISFASLSSQDSYAQMLRNAPTMVSSALLSSSQDSLNNAPALRSAPTVVSSALLSSQVNVSHGQVLRNAPTVLMSTSGLADHDSAAHTRMDIVRKVSTQQPCPQQFSTSSFPPLPAATDTSNPAPAIAVSHVDCGRPGKNVKKKAVKRNQRKKVEKKGPAVTRTGAPSALALSVEGTSAAITTVATASDPLTARNLSGKMAVCPDTRTLDNGAMPGTGSLTLCGNPTSGRTKSISSTTGGDEAEVELGEQSRTVPLSSDIHVSSATPSRIFTSRPRQMSRIVEKLVAQPVQTHDCGAASSVTCVASSWTPAVQTQAPSVGVTQYGQSSDWSALSSPSTSQQEVLPNTVAATLTVTSLPSAIASPSPQNMTALWQTVPGQTVDVMNFQTSSPTRTVPGQRQITEVTGPQSLTFQTGASAVPVTNQPPHVVQVSGTDPALTVLPGGSVPSRTSEATSARGIFTSPNVLQRGSKRQTPKVVRKVTSDPAVPVPLVTCPPQTTHLPQQKMSAFQPVPSSPPAAFSKTQRQQKHLPAQTTSSGFLMKAAGLHSAGVLTQSQKTVASARPSSQQTSSLSTQSSFFPVTVIPVDSKSQQTLLQTANVTPKLLPESHLTTPTLSKTTPTQDQPRARAPKALPLSSKTSPTVPKPFPVQTQTIHTTSHVTSPLQATPVASQTVLVTSQAMPSLPQTTLPQTAPITSQATPVTSQATPVTSQATPVASQATPVASQATPVTSQATPVASQATPVASQATPVTSQTTPVASQATPVTSQTGPGGFPVSVTPVREGKRQMMCITSPMNLQQLQVLLSHLKLPPGCLVRQISSPGKGMGSLAGVGVAEITVPAPSLPASSGDAGVEMEVSTSDHVQPGSAESPVLDVAHRDGSSQVSIRNTDAQKGSGRSRMQRKKSNGDNSSRSMESLPNANAALSAFQKHSPKVSQASTTTPCTVAPAAATALENTPPAGVGSVSKSHKVRKSRVKGPSSTKSVSSLASAHTSAVSLSKAGSAGTPLQTGNERQMAATSAVHNISAPRSSSSGCLSSDDHHGGQYSESRLSAVLKETPYTGKARQAGRDNCGPFSTVSSSLAVSQIRSGIENVHIPGSPALKEILSSSSRSATIVGPRWRSSDLHDSKSATGASSESDNFPHGTSAEHIRQTLPSPHVPNVSVCSSQMVSRPNQFVGNDSSQASQILPSGPVSKPSRSKRSKSRKSQTSKAAEVDETAAPRKEANPKQKDSDTKLCSGRGAEHYGVSVREMADSPAPADRATHTVRMDSTLSPPAVLATDRHQPTAYPSHSPSAVTAYTHFPHAVTSSSTGVHSVRPDSASAVGIPHHVTTDLSRGSVAPFALESASDSSSNMSQLPSASVTFPERSFLPGNISTAGSGDSHPAAFEEQPLLRINTSSIPRSDNIQSSRNVASVSTAKTGVPVSDVSGLRSGGSHHWLPDTASIRSNTPYHFISSIPADTNTVSYPQLNSAGRSSIPYLMPDSAYEARTMMSHQATAVNNSVRSNVPHFICDAASTGGPLFSGAAASNGSNVTLVFNPHHVDSLPDYSTAALDRFHTASPAVLLPGMELDDVSRDVELLSGHGLFPFLSSSSRSRNSSGASSIEPSITIDPALLPCDLMQIMTQQGLALTVTEVVPPGGNEDSG